MSPGTLSVLAEIDALDDLSLIDGVQGIGILNIEDILKLGRENARLLLREISDRGYAQPAIRFFDQHPRLPADSVTLGFRGARLLGDRSVVNDFLHAVDALLLEEEPTVVLPMYAHAQEFQKFAALVSPLSCSLGVTIECPEAALGINQIVGDCAVVEVGLNDLTQFTLAWDRNSVNFDVMSSSEISHGVGILIEKVSECVADRRVQYSLGLDLRPSRELVERIGALGVAEISCPAVLASRWLEIMA
jgi:phosphoenolpyruvate-protein kinase (PTS system EI component)